MFCLLNGVVCVGQSLGGDVGVVLFHVFEEQIFFVPCKGICVRAHFDRVAVIEAYDFFVPAQHDVVQGQIERNQTDNAVGDEVAGSCVVQRFH